MGIHRIGNLSEGVVTMPRIGRPDRTTLVRALLRGRPDGPGFAVRLDWLDPATGAIRHDFTQFTPDLDRAVRRAEGTRRFWAPGPVRPLAVTVVPIDRAAFRAHAECCVSPACPTTAALLGMDAAGVDPGARRTDTGSASTSPPTAPTRPRRAPH